MISFLGSNYRGIKKDGTHFDADPDWYKKIDKKVSEDCCQLVKANSIKGNKQNDVTVVFTPASNLQKDGRMDIGQVGFHNKNMTFKTRIPTRTNEIVNRLEKTKKWLTNDLEGEYLKRMKDEKEEDQKNAKAAEKTQKEQARKTKEDKDLSAARQRVDTVSTEEEGKRNELDRMMASQSDKDALSMLEDLGF